MKLNSTISNKLYKKTKTITKNLLINKFKIKF